MIDLSKYKYIYPNMGQPINQWGICWRITDWCNYNCPYCIECVDHHYAKQPKETQKTVEESARCIREKISNKYVLFSLLGGEIGFYDLVSICRILFEGNNVHGVVNLTTNLSAPLENYISFCEQNYGDKLKFKISASYQWGDIDAFLKKANVLKNYSSFQCSTVVWSKTTLDEVKKVAERFKENEIIHKFTIGRIPNTTNRLYEISDEIKEFILFENANFKDTVKVVYSDGKTKTFKKRSDFINHVAREQDGKGAKFKGMYCFTGVQINPDGKVYGGSCHDKIYRYKGMITDKNLSLEPVKKVCSGEGYCGLAHCMLIWSGKY